MSFLLTNLVSEFLLPPLGLLLAAMAGLAVGRSHPRLGRTLVAGSLALLWVCSTPYFAEGALRLLENSVQAVDTKAKGADAIVVLGAGIYFNAPEYGADTIKEAALVRLRYGAKLHRDTGKPILVTGGTPQGNEIAEALLMKIVLEQEFMIPVRWAESASNNTLENARYSFRLLQETGIKRIYLVTHAWHLPRSIMAFEAAGFEVVPAPTVFTTRYDTSVLDFVPKGSAMRNSAIFMHELVGLVWYRIRI